MDSVFLKDASDKIFRKITELSGRPPEKLKDEITRMREALTSHRDRLLSGYMNRTESLTAYLNYHLPIHLPETFWILEQNRVRLTGSPAKESKLRSARVLDLGAGPGTASLSLLLWLKSGKLALPEQFDLVDLSQKALGTAETLLREVQGENLSVRKLRGNLFEGLRKMRGPYEWILLSHVLNEFGSGPRVRDKKLEVLALIRKNLMNEHSHLLIVEPPLREPTIDLQWLRDEIMTGDLQDFEIVGPCPAGVELCPLLFEKKGWCYAQPPRKQLQAAGLAPWDQRLERLLDIELTQPGFSYLLLRSRRPQPALNVVAPHFIALSDFETRPAWVCSKSRNVRFADQPNPHRGAYLVGQKDYSSRVGALVKSGPKPERPKKSETTIVGGSDSTSSSKKAPRNAFAKRGRISKRNRG